MSTVAFTQSDGNFIITDSVAGITYSSSRPLQFNASGGSVQVVSNNFSTIGTYLLANISSIGGAATSGTVAGAIIQLNALFSSTTAPIGVSTAELQTLGNTSLSSINSNMATAAKQDTGNASLASIASNTTTTTYHTYVASIRNLTFAATPTAVLEIIGSPTKKVKILEIEAWVTSSATATNIDVSIVRQSTLCTGGTSTTLTNVAFDSTAPASGATIKAYTANPTLGTAVGSVSIHNILVTLAASTTASPIAFTEEHSIETAPVINNNTESYILNFNSNVIAATRSADIYITYVEY